MWASHRRCRAVRCPVVSLLVLDKCCTARALCHLAWSGPHRHAGAPIKTGHRSPPIFSFILTRLSSPPPFPPLQRLQLQPHLTLESKPPPPPNLLFREPLSAGHPLSIPPRLSPLSTSPCCRNRRRPQELRRCTEPLLLPHQHHTVWVSPRPHHLAGPGEPAHTAGSADCCHGAPTHESCSLGAKIWPTTVHPIFIFSIPLSF
jgi:hypothetical protein